MKQKRIKLFVNVTFLLIGLCFLSYTLIFLKGDAFSLVISSQFISLGLFSSINSFRSYWKERRLIKEGYTNCFGFWFDKTGNCKEWDDFINSYNLAKKDLKCLKNSV